MILKEAVQKIIEARNAYYGSSGKPIMTDQEYDALEDWVRKIDPSHPVLQKTGPEQLSESWEKAEHQIPMESLNKVHTEEDFRKWASKFPKGTIFVAQPKFDGLSLELVYKNMSLSQAITRGTDGKIGEDITKNAKKIPDIVTDSIPACSIRGEILLSKSNFERINDTLTGQDKYSNERNAAAGISRRLDGAYCQYLSFISYDIIPKDMPDIKTEPNEIDKPNILSNLGFKVPVTYSGGIEAMVNAYSKFRTIRESFPFGLDGVVIKVNNIALKHEMGSIGGKPRTQIAWKFDPPGATTHLLKVEWPIGRTGVITPLGILEPVEIDGSVITKATLHNIAEIKRLGIGIGDLVMVIKAGDIIPKLVSVLEHKNNPIEIPTHCPDCGGSLDNDGIRLLCRNEGCSSRTFWRIMNWINVVSIDGLGEALVDKLFNAGSEREGKFILKEISDLYRLKVEDIVSIEGWGEKSATTIINNINNTRRLDPVKFLAAVGIPGISHRTAEDLINAFKSIDRVLQATKEDIIALKGYSEISATAIINGLKIYGNEIKNLMTIINLSPATESTYKTGKLAGQTFCFTGTMSRPRGEYQKMVEMAGGKNLSMVTKDLNYLVCNDDRGSSKSIKAKKYGTKIITEQEFLDMIGLQSSQKEPKSVIENISLFEEDDGNSF